MDRPPAIPDSGRPVDLHDSGLLWLINRCVFHPRGYALGVNGAGQTVLLGDGTEPYAFGLQPGVEDDLFARATATLQPAATAAATSGVGE